MEVNNEKESDRMKKNSHDRFLKKNDDGMIERLYDLPLYAL